MTITVGTSRSVAVAGYVRPVDTFSIAVDGYLISTSVVPIPLPVACPPRFVALIEYPFADIAKAKTPSLLANFDTAGLSVFDVTDKVLFTDQRLEVAADISVKTRSTAGLVFTDEIIYPSSKILIESVELEVVNNTSVPSIALSRQLVDLDTNREFVGLDMCNCCED